MKKRKVMHVLSLGGYSGAENVAITLINSIKDNYDNVYVSLFGEIQDILQENQVTYYGVEKVSIKNIKKAIKEIQPDLIHAHDFNAGVVCALSTNIIPIINHLHNNASWIKRCCPKSLIYGVVAWKFKRILTVSESVMNEYIFGGLFKKKTKVLENPVNIQSILYKSKIAPITDLSDLMFLGRLTEPKNPLAFIEIVKEVVKKIPNLKAVMVGDGELRKEVEQRITELNLYNNIILYGFQKNPYGLLQNTKVMCMPSVWEGFGLAAVEGLSFGKPVIAAPVGGLKKIINNECGLLCDSIDSYADGIIELLEDDVKYQRKSVAAYKRALDFDNSTRYKEEILELYRFVLQQR